MAEQFSKPGKKILLGADNNALVFLFAVNTLVFVIINFIKVIYYLSDIPLDYFYRQITDWVVLSPVSELALSRPWSLLTFMFIHIGFWHLFSSMLWLWCFGYILQDLTGNSKLIPIYLYGGFIGGILFLVTDNLFPGIQAHISSVPAMLGAGAPVMAIAVATTTLAPEYRLFPMISGGIPLWILTLVFVAIDFTSLTGYSAGLVSAHLGAALIGFLFIRQLRRGYDWGAWMHQLINWLDDLFSPEKKHRKQQAKDTLYYDANRKPYEKISRVTQQKLDAILDKINQQGFQFLTEEERDFLKRASSEDL